MEEQDDADQEQRLINEGTDPFILLASEVSVRVGPANPAQSTRHGRKTAPSSTTCYSGEST